MLGFFQSRVVTVDYAPSKAAPVKRHFSHFISHMLDHHQVKSSYIFCVGLHPVQYFEYVNFHVFEGLVLVASIIWLYKCICTEFPCDTPLSSKSWH
jgi:hypothetical protein